MDSFSRSFLLRVCRAAVLHVDLYEEVKADTEAMQQAMIVVVLSSLAVGVGKIEEIGLDGMMLVTIVALLGWYVMAYLTSFIGSKIIPEPRAEADSGALLRTIGFSTAPGIIRVLGLLTGSGGPSVFISFWMFGAMVVAVRQVFSSRSTLEAGQNVGEVTRDYASSAPDYKRRFLHFIEKVSNEHRSVSDVGDYKDTRRVVAVCAIAWIITWMVERSIRNLLFSLI